jgi:murein L,D-transpeptidase YafK
MRNRFLKIAISAVLIGWIGQRSIAADSFQSEQDRYPRVRTARARTQRRLEILFRDAGLGYPAREVFLRVFKQEGQVELWARNDIASPFLLVHSYPVCAFSGTIGPKRCQGDMQVPEGFYFIDGFNPWSRFHLSLRVDYPNASDRILGDRRSPGGDIFIHGSCVTIGCIPLRDGPIEEIYLAAVDARSAGQRHVPVHIFPCRLLGSLSALEREAWRRPGLMDFWMNLKEGFDFFEKTRRPPRIMVNSRGRYLFR